MTGHVTNHLTNHEAHPADFGILVRTVAELVAGPEPERDPEGWLDRVARLLSEYFDGDGCLVYRVDWE